MSSVLESSRRKACDFCHRKKIKCDFKSLPCSNCVLHKVPCAFSSLKKTRKSDTLQKGASRRSITENRKFIQVTQPRTTAVWPRDVQQQQITAPVSHDVIVDVLTQTAQFIVSINPYIESNNFLAPLSTPNISKSPTLNIHQRPPFLDHSLPPLAAALPLLNSYFMPWNAYTLLFSPTTISKVVRTTHSTTSRAAFSIILTLAYRLRAMQDLRGQLDDSTASAYLRAAQKPLDELATRPPTLLDVQVLLGLATVFQGTPNPRPTYLISATIAELIGQLNLGQASASATLSHEKDNARERRYVFWNAYILDRDIAMRKLQPPLLHAEDIDVQLPGQEEEHEEAGPGQDGYMYTTDGRKSIHYLRLRVQLAEIQGRIYAELYSLRALKASTEVRQCARDALDRDLDAWKAAIPDEFQPANLMRSLDRSSMLLMIVMHLTWLCSLTMVHRVYLHDDLWLKRLVDRREIGKMLPSAWKKLVLSARECLQLIYVIPQGDYLCVWLVLCTIISGAVILLANILASPTHPFASSDLVIVVQIWRLVEHLSQIVCYEELQSITGFCQELESRVRTSMAQATNSQSLTTIPKRMHEELEDEFVGFVETGEEQHWYATDAGYSGPGF